MTKFAIYDFFAKTLFKNFARDVHFFSRKFNFFLLFSFLIIGWGEGGRVKRSFAHCHLKCV